MSDGPRHSTDAGQREQRDSQPDARTEFGTASGYERARELFAALERDGHLDSVVRRAKRAAGGGLVVALFAYGVSPGGLTGAVLDVWALVAVGFAGLGLLVWLAASAFAEGELAAPDATDAGVTLDLETVGAPLLVAMADRTNTSAGVRLLWSLLLGEATLPAAAAAADETDTVASGDVARLRRTLRWAAVASVVAVAGDLLLRVVGLEPVLALLAGGGSDLPPLPGLAGLGELLALSPGAWLAVFAAVLVVGSVVGLAFAVSMKS